MKKNFKKILSFILAISMAIPSVQLPVYATEADGYEVETVADDLTGDTTENKDTVVTEVVEKHIEGTITADTTWNDGDIIGDVTISGGTVENPIQITVNGTVKVMGQITLDKNAAAYVVFEGTGTLVSKAASSKALIWTEGNNFRHNLTIKGITLDGGAVWSGNDYQTLKRGTTNQGRTASGNGAILFVRYTDVFIEDAIIQNQYGSQPKCAAVNLGYATMNVTDSIICNNYHTGDRGGAVYMRNGAKFVAKNTIFNGNHGDTGGVIGTSVSNAYDSIVIVKDCKFYDNYATTAGAVFCNQDNTQNGIGELTIKKCEFYNNGSPKSLIYNHAYSFMPTTIVDSYFHDNACSFYDYSDRNENVFVSGDTIIETDAWSSYDYGVPLVINGALGEKAKIEIDAASAEHLLNNGGCVVSVADDYTITEEDLKKISIDGYEKFVLVDVNGDNRYDLVPVTEEVQAVEVTLKDSLDSTAEEKQIVYKEIASLPVCKFGHKGLVFAGWVDENRTAVAKQKFTESVTLTATWKIETPTVKLSRDVATLKATVTNSYDNVDYSYQWYVDDVAIDGATESTYTMTDVNSHSYKCVVTASVDGFDSVTVSASITSSAPAAAQIGDAKFATLAEAITAANAIEDGATVKLLQDVTLDESMQVTGKATLDLNGKKITGTDNSTGSFALINVMPGADFTVEGTGTITLTATNNRGWGGYSSVISNQRGKLTVNGGTIEHLGGTDMAYAIDNLTNGKGTYAETIINGGTVKSTYRAIRQFLNGVEADNTLTITGGTIEGTKSAVWMQDPNVNANSGALTIGAYAVVKGNVYLDVTEGSTEWPVEVSIAKAALADGSKVVSENVPVGYAVVEKDGVYGVKVSAVYEVSTKAELDAAVKKAVAGDIIKLVADIDYLGSALVINEAITLDLGGKVLTTDYGWGGLHLKGNCAVKNGTLNHKGAVTAIKAWDVAAIEDLVIDVAFKAEGKTIGGIVIQENASGIGTIKNVTIKGEGLTNGIETFNCGNATEPVIGSMENVTIDAKSTGLLISAPCGTAANCDIKGGVSGIELWIKGTYSASIDLVKCTVEGGTQAIYVHDEFNENPDTVNSGTIKITVDDATEIIGNPLTQTIARAEDVHVDEAIIEDAVAKANDTYFNSFKDAIAAANKAESGATVTLLEAVTLGEKITISGNVTISGGNANARTSTSATITRADGYTGTLFVVNAGATLTLDNGLVIDGGNEYVFDAKAYKADAEDWNKSIPTEESAKWFTPEAGAPVATAYMITTTGGTVNLNDITIQNNYSINSGVVSAGANATINLEGAKITHIAATQGNGIVVNASGAGINVNMNEGTVIDGNHVGGNHGIFKIYSGTVFTMNGGEITNNTGWNSNGVAVGVYGATFNLKGGKICSNTGVYGPSNGRNAVIYLHSGHKFEMTGGTICHNSGRSRGGIDAPYNSGTAKISGGEVLDNISRGNWDTPDVLGTTAMQITGGTFTQDVSQWCAEGYSVELNDDGTYGVVKGEAKVNGIVYDTFAEAVAAINATEEDVTLTLLKNITISETLKITKNTIIDGNSKTLTYTGSDRAIDVPSDAEKAVDLKIKNLNVVCGANYCQRGINYNEDGVFYLYNVTVNGTNVTYAVNLPGKSNGAQVTIKNSNLTGNIALNVWGAGSTIKVTDTVLTSVDNNTAEGYAAVSLNNDGTTSAEGTVVTIEGGKITATDEKGQLSSAVRNSTATGNISVSETTEVTGNIVSPVAIVTYEGTDDFYSFATLQDAIDKAIETKGNVKLLSDVELKEILLINGTVTLDGNGKTLTSTAGRAINVSGAKDVTIKNLTIKASGERAINIIKGATNVTIDNVTATAANYTVCIPSSAANAVVTVKNSDLTGLNTVNIAAPGAKVTVDKCTITCNDQTDIEGYDAIAVNKDAVAAKVTVTNTTIVLMDDDSVEASNQAKDAELTVNGTVIQQKDVAYISYGDTYYSFETLNKAIAKANADETIVLMRDVTTSEIVTIDKSVTIDGAGHTLTYTGSGASARAINVAYNESAKVNLTIKNLTVDCTSSYCQRGINYNDDGALTLEGVTVTGKNVTYALNLPGSSDNATVAITNSSLTGNIALNVWGENSKIKVTNTALVSVDNSTAEGYAAVVLNNDGTSVANGTLVEIKGGSITAKDEKGNLATAVRNATSTGNVVVSESTTVTGLYTRPVAIVDYGTDQFYSCNTLQAAINKAIEGNAKVKLIANVEEDEIITIAGKVTIDGNGFELKSTAKRAINIDTTEEVTITNLTITGGKGCERGINIINKAGKTNLDQVKISGVSHYGAHIATSAGSATLNIKNSDLTGYGALAVYGAGSTVNVENSNLTGVNNYKGESNAFATIAYGATDAIITVKGGTVTAKSNEGCEKQSILCHQTNAVCTGTKVTLDTELVLVDGKTGYFFIPTTKSTVAVRAEYADELLAEGYVTSEADTNGMCTVIGSAVAKVGDVSYATLEDAIAAAVSGDTVVLLEDVTTTGLVFLKGITLDLNGKKLTTDYLFTVDGNYVVDSYIVGNDSSVRAKTGMLIVPEGNIVIQKDNEHMPVWTGEGYFFATMLMQQPAKYYKVDLANDTVKFGFRPSFGKNYNTTLFKDGAKNNDITISAYIVWEVHDDKGNVTGVYSQSLAYSESQVEEVYSSTSKVFGLTLTGIKDAKNLRVVSVVTSGTGAECYGEYKQVTGK